MKYGIIVNGRVTEPVSVPDQLPNWADSPITFLLKLFPGKTGWVLVSDDAVPGTIANNDGTFETVVPPAPQKPTPTLSSTGFMDVAIAGIAAANNSGQGAAEARFQEIIEAARDYSNPGNEITSKRVRYVHSRYIKAVTYDKNVVAGMLILFRSASVGNITAGEAAGIIAAWPT
jgi:hypothetical protein